MHTYLVFNANGDLLDGENKTEAEAIAYAKHLKAGDRIVLFNIDVMMGADMTPSIVFCARDDGDLPTDCYAYGEYIGTAPDTDPAAAQADAALKLEREYR